MELGQLGVWYFFDGLSSPAAAEAAKRIESCYGSFGCLRQSVSRRLHSIMGAVTDGDPECGDGNYQHLSPRTGCHASLAEFAL